MRIRIFWLVFSLIIIAFFSFSKKEATVEVQGKVLHKDRGLPSVEVAVLRTDLNQEYPYYEPTTLDGTYRLKFNIHEGRPVQIVYKRKGYSLLKIEKTFSGIKEHIKLEDIDLIRMPGVKENYKLSPLKTAGYSFLDVFPSKNATETPDSYTPGNIEYFNYIDKQICSEIHGAFWYYVNFKIKGKKDPVKGYVLQ